MLGAGQDGRSQTDARPDCLKKFRDFAWSDLDSLTLHQSARIERTEKGFQIWIYNRTDYGALLDQLEKQGLSLPTADEWPICAAAGAAPCSPGGWNGLLHASAPF